MACRINILGKPVNSWLVGPSVLVRMSTTEAYQESTHAEKLLETPLEQCV